MAPLEGYIQRMLWCLVHQKVIPAEAAHDPWAPAVDPADFDRIGVCVARLAEDARPMDFGHPPTIFGHSRGVGSNPPIPDMRFAVDRKTDASLTSHLLPRSPDLAKETLRRVRNDHDRFAIEGLPEELDGYLLQTYGLDMAASYGGIPLRNPWGKASGQLSLNRSSVEEAADAGLALVVLKTVIAQDAAAAREAMSAWAIKESQMALELIRGTESPETMAGLSPGSGAAGGKRSINTSNSCAAPARSAGNARSWWFRRLNTTFPCPGTKAGAPKSTRSRRGRSSMLISIGSGGVLPLPLEKDFSPTLAGSDRALSRESVLDWIRQVPGLIRAAVPTPDQVRVGLKLFNSLEDDGFQQQLLAEAVRGPDRADFLVYANRLFDPDRVFESKRGVAYGGPDLSCRNLRILSALRRAQQQGSLEGRTPLELSGTGDISSGRLAVEYALRGCTSFQIHTLFQLPASEYAMRSGTKVQKALHRLYFDPGEGFIVWSTPRGQAAGPRCQRR